MRWLIVLVLAACSSDATPPPCADGAVCDGACVAMFGGNFVDVTRDAGTCARLTPALEFTVASRLIGSPLQISIELDTPAPGRYSSETVTTWSAVQARSIGNGACVYSAGDQAVPHGSFTLNLTEIDATSAHGTLEVVEYVHALEATSCGAADLETVDLVF